MSSNSDLAALRFLADAVAAVFSTDFKRDKTTEGASPSFVRNEASRQELLEFLQLSLPVLSLTIYTDLTEAIRDKLATVKIE